MGLKLGLQDVFAIAYFCKIYLSERFLKILIFADSTTDAGRLVDDIKALYEQNIIF